MVAEHDPARPLELALDSRELLHDVGAVGVLLDHAQHGVEVAPRRAQPVDDRSAMLFFHGCILPHLGWGSYVVPKHSGRGPGGRCKKNAR